MAPDPASVSGLAEHVPSFSIVVEDLAALSDDELHSMSVAAIVRLALWLMRDAREEDRVLAALDRWIAAFSAVLHAPDGMRAFQLLVRYVSIVMKPESFDTFCATLVARLPESEDTMVSAYEHLTQKSLEKGLEKGLQKGRAEMLQRLLRRKFQAITPEHEAEIAAASPERLDLLADRLLTASTIDEVFAP